MLSKIYQQYSLKPSIKYIDLYNFIKFVECFRLKDKLSIKDFYTKNKNQMGLYYFSAGAGLSQSTPALLESIGIKNYKEAYNVIDTNTDTIFLYIINLKLNKDYFSTYCKYAKNGKLDKIIKF